MRLNAFANHTKTRLESLQSVWERNCVAVGTQLDVLHILSMRSRVHGKTGIRALRESRCRTSMPTTLAEHGELSRHYRAWKSSLEANVQYSENG